MLLQFTQPKSINTFVSIMSHMKVINPGAISGFYHLNRLVYFIEFTDCIQQLKSHNMMYIFPHKKKAYKRVFISE